ncbi:MAG: hypothetical protein A2Z17_02550 [Gammaproteobacteria bacterium RBG_16_66_13]|nr:MAG: hypothetical protein A2Z17_02550 [Gammaproteobacteria bacterium RBG_16_66_13]
MALAISVLDLALSACFTLIVAAQWLARRRLHQLFWASALLVWTLAVAAETAAAAQGAWSPLTYRVYYACGALMVAAWLGAGSLFLAASPRLARANAFLVAALSLAGVLAMAAFPVDPSLLGRTDALGFVEVKVFPIVPVRLLVILANVLGTLTFVGSALFSLWRLRDRVFSRARTGGILLIALGGMTAAAAHSLGVLGGPGLFRISELAAILLIFTGYALSGRRLPVQAVATSMKIA